MKILILGDLHAGKTRTSSTHPGEIRQASSEATYKLHDYIPHFNQQAYDLVINLGDAIREEGDNSTDIALFERSLASFNEIVGRKIFIPGNHDLTALSENEINSVLARFGIPEIDNGLLQIADMKVIWITSQINSSGLAVVNNATLDWLEGQLKPNDKIVLFSHYSILPLDGMDNYYFDQDYQSMTITNSKEIMRIVGKAKSVIAINGHTHMHSYKASGNVQSLSALSFSENITAMQFKEANPGIYSVLSSENNQLMFRSYSGNYCFLSVELSV